MGIDPNHPAIAQALAKGLIYAERPPARGTRKAELVAPAFDPPNVWVVPCEVPSLANDRDWRVRNRVTQAHRKAVSKALGPHLRALAPFAERVHGGGAVRVVLTRLGGRALDRHENLPASLKYIVDAICLLIGVDDANPLMHFEPRQEPGGPCGVRIEIANEGHAEAAA